MSNKPVLSPLNILLSGGNTGLLDVTGILNPKWWKLLKRWSS